MKKQLILGCLLVFLTMFAQRSFAQSTEGTDFWATFLQADHLDSDNKSIQLSLTVSSRETCDVTVDNPHFTGKSISVAIDGGTASTKTLPFTVTVTANQATEIQLYSGTAKETNANNEFCYTRKGEVVDNSAVHVTSTKPISLYASNYKPASFDAANVLPVSALQTEYLIQSYTPSDHGNAPQGSHFAVVAVEDNTKVLYTPSVLTIKNRAGYTEYLEKKDKTYTNNPFLSDEQNEAARQEFEAEKAALIAQWGNFIIGEHTDSVVLQKGQVYYVWTDDGEGYDYDLSGSKVTATKPVAVFQGNPHTNLPYHKDFNISSPIKQRDHLFSQAMPLSTWGNTFAVTRSSRKRDVLRIMAQEDGTEVRINGVLKHTFDFSSSDPKEHNQYWEIQIGDAVTAAGENGNTSRPDAEIPGGSCFIETSCPCAVHLFIVSQQWDGNKNNNGDPAMLWVNPIEQRIDQITFSTYSSKNDKGDQTSHYVNVVTDSASVRTTNKMLLNDEALTGWQPIVGSDRDGDGQYRYYYVRHQLPSTAKNSKPLSYTLKRENAKEGDGFIAYVYGFTSNESYGYNAGGATKPLTQYITINGEIFSPDKENTLCGEDTIKFACHPDYEYKKIEWYFGDGSSDLTNSDSVPHYYTETGVYAAYVLIYRESSNLCRGQNAVDSIPITVTIGRYQFGISETEIPCPVEGQTTRIGKVYYTNEGKVDLTGDNVVLEFDEDAIDAGFRNDQLVIFDDYFQITIPEDAHAGSSYGIHLQITSDCGGTDTSMVFTLPFSNDVIDQRYANVLGLTNDSSFAGYILSNFQWYRSSDSTKVNGQTSAILNFYDLPTDEFEDDAYYVCFTLTNKETQKTSTTCACAKPFTSNDKQPQFTTDPDDLTIIAVYSLQSGNKVFVNADWHGETDIECYAQWITASGSIYQGLKFDIPDGGCTIDAPTEEGLYLLRITTGKGSRSFKFIINK